MRIRLFLRVSLTQSLCRDKVEEGGVGGSARDADEDEEGEEADELRYAEALLEEDLPRRDELGSVKRRGITDLLGEHVDLRRESEALAIEGLSMLFKVEECLPNELFLLVPLRSDVSYFQALRRSGNSRSPPTLPTFSRPPRTHLSASHSAPQCSASIASGCARAT